MQIICDAFMGFVWTTSDQLNMAKFVQTLNILCGALIEVTCLTEKCNGQ